MAPFLDLALFKLHPLSIAPPFKALNKELQPPEFSRISFLFARLCLAKAKVPTPFIPALKDETIEMSNSQGTKLQIIFHFKFYAPFFIVSFEFSLLLQPLFENLILHRFERVVLVFWITKNPPFRTSCFETKTSVLMRNYEVTFIVDPVLSGGEIKTTAQAYVDHLQKKGCKIVHVDEMGLRQLTYPIKRRTTGVYYCIEYEAPNGEGIAPMELALRRDERIMRFLTVHLDKFGVKYNQDKRDGKIGKAKKIAKPVEEVKTVKREPKRPKPAVQQPQGDNLKRIEGIGPKVSEALKSAGVTTFAKLASMTPEDIKAILDKDSDRFHNQDPGTWAKQAELAAAGDWDKLKAWQEDLKTEKMVPAKPKAQVKTTEEEE